MRKAFTWIEFAIVCCIVAIITAIVVPNVMLARSQQASEAVAFVPGQGFDTQLGRVVVLELVSGNGTDQDYSVYSVLITKSGAATTTTLRRRTILAIQTAPAGPSNQKVEPEAGAR